MKFINTLLSCSFICAALAAPIESDAGQISSEAILGYIDLTQDPDVGVATFSNSTFSGLIFYNSTIEDDKDLAKRDAKADWIRLRIGGPMKKREAEAEAGLMRLSLGKPLKKREADAEAGWMRLSLGKPL